MLQKLRRYAQNFIIITRKYLRNNFNRSLHNDNWPDGRYVIRCTATDLVRLTVEFFRYTMAYFRKDHVHRKYDLFPLLLTNTIRATVSSNVRYEPANWDLRENVRLRGD